MSPPPLGCVVNLNPPDYNRQRNLFLTINQYDQRNICLWVLRN